MPKKDLNGAEAVLRAICRRLPESIEMTTYGHPTFQAGPKKTFAVLDDHEQPGKLCIAFKASAADQQSLIDHVGFHPCKFGAKHGWTVRVVDESIDWEQMRSLVTKSYRLVALKRMIAALESGA